MLTLLRFLTAANRTASKPFSASRIPSISRVLSFSCCTRDGSTRLSDVARVVLVEEDDADWVKRYSDPRYSSGAYVAPVVISSSCRINSNVSLADNSTSSSAQVQIRVSQTAYWRNTANTPSNSVTLSMSNTAKKLFGTS
jgi:hypothetical protein